MNSRKIEQLLLKVARSARHSELGTRLFPTQRDRLARAHLRGSGIEIGALYKPMSVPAGCEVKYVDRATREMLVASFPELDPEEIIVPDIIDDGFILETIASGSQDFVIANHVLEHSSNPLGALRNWSRVTRDGGLLFITVPIAERCFDKGRELTSLEHLVEDDRLYQTGASDALKSRNRRHYAEWVRIALPAIQGQPVQSPDPALEQDIERRLEAMDEIHFHTFSNQSFCELLGHLSKVFTPKLDLVAYAQGRLELSAVLRKNVNGTLI